MGPLLLIGQATGEQVSGGWRFQPPSPRLVTVGPPAAGADWSWPAPQGQLLRLRAVSAKLTADATAGTRAPLLQVVDADAAVVLSVPLSAAVAATAAAVITWAAELPAAYKTGSDYVAPLPGILLPANLTVKVTTAALAAGDQWSDVLLTVELY